ncbi:hypothetical protein BO70DRAFT_300637, partial [Aspergillus heteromorphus CBS 117.55]
PYRVGNPIELDLVNDNEYAFDTVRGRITQVFEPFSRSCVVSIHIEPPDDRFQGPLLLKVFDRRFAYYLRARYHMPYWTHSIELQAREFIRSGAGRSFMDQCINNSLRRPDSAELARWTAAQNEAYLNVVMQKYFRTELEAYQRLKSLQGEHIPKCLGRASMAWKLPEDFEEFQSPAILLQQIEGYPLERLEFHAKPVDWDRICRDAINIVHHLNSCHIINPDAHPNSLVVRTDSPDTPSKVFMVDFTLCKFRSKDCSIRDWRKQKAAADEEGAIGYAMQILLQNNYHYQRSQMYLDLDMDFLPSIAPAA